MPTHALLDPQVLLMLALAFVGGAGAVVGVAGTFGPAIAERMARDQAIYTEQLKDIFARGGTARTLVVLQYWGPPCLFILLGIILGKPLIGLAAGFAAWVLPRFYIQRARRSRRERLAEQAIDVMGAITATTKAGMNLQESVEEIARKLPAPASQEFSMICERVRAGQTLDASMKVADRRLDLPGFSLLFQSLAIHREKGGKLADLLERAGASLREMSQLEQKVKSQTSGIRLASRVMVCMPIVLGLMLYSMDPEHISILFNTFLGNCVLVAIAILDVAGFVMLQKLAEPDI